LYAAALLSVLGRPEAPDHVRAMAVILRWKLLPEDISDISDDAPHPCDALGDAVAGPHLAVFRDLPLSEREPSQLANLAASLFGRMAALALHSGSNAPFAGELARTLAVCPGPAIPISVVLETIRVSALLEMDDVTAVARSLARSRTASARRLLNGCRFGAQRAGVSRRPGRHHSPRKR